MKHTPSQKPNGIWILYVSAGIIFLNFPFIQVFNRQGSLLGVPTLVVYIFLAWSFLLLGLIIFSRILCWKSAQDERERTQRKDQQ